MVKSYYSLGLMSGTSMDGVDASIIKSDGELSAEIIDEMYCEYDNKLKSKLKRAVKLCISRHAYNEHRSLISNLEKEITIFHGQIANLIIKKNKNIKVDLVGFHGHTILHKPKKGYSIQIGNPKLLSKLIHCDVVSNFRKNDILNGGQGAPLAPLYHYLIIKKLKLELPAIIINIGGISNITYLNHKQKIFGFDAGPGNCLLDEWISKHTKQNFDRNGKIAKIGKVNTKILNKMLKKKQRKGIAPKSFDIKDFSLSTLKKINLKDGAATLSMLTVQSLHNSINNLEHYPQSILVSGGGRKNNFILENLRFVLKRPVYLIDKFRFNGDFIESQAFAYLAIRAFLKKTLTLPSTTGVKMPVSGGAFFFKN